MTTIVLICGLAAIAAGAALIYLPAGLIVGGVLATWAALRAAAAEAPGLPEVPE